MADLREKILYSLFLCLLYLNCIAALKCDADLSVVECKIKFGKAFDEQFKSIHIATIKKIFTPYIQALRDLSAQLPKDRAWTAAMQQNAEELDDNLKKLDIWNGNNSVLLETVNYYFADLDMDALNDKVMPEFADKFTKVKQKYGLKTIVADSLAKMLSNTADKWHEMFAELRDKDLDSFSMYTKINMLMKYADDDKSKAKVMDGLKSISEFFEQIPYIRGVKKMLFGLEK